MPSQEKQLKRFGDVPDRVVIQQMQESSVKIKSSAGWILLPSLSSENWVQYETFWMEDEEQSQVEK